MASSACNPLDRLTPDSLDLGEDAASLTEALVMDPPCQVTEVHWNEEAVTGAQGSSQRLKATKPTIGPGPSSCWMNLPFWTV